MSQTSMDFSLKIEELFRKEISEDLFKRYSDVLDSSSFFDIIKVSLGAYLGIKNKRNLVYDIFEIISKYDDFSGMKLEDILESNSELANELYVDIKKLLTE